MLPNRFSKLSYQFKLSLTPFERFSCSSLIISLVNFLLDFNHSAGCAVIIHYDFSLSIPDYWWGWTFLNMIIGHLDILFGIVPVEVSYLLFFGASFLFDLRVVYTLEMSPLCCKSLFLLWRAFVPLSIDVYSGIFKCIDILIFNTIVFFFFFLSFWLVVFVSCWRSLSYP